MDTESWRVVFPVTVEARTCPSYVALTEGLPTVPKKPPFTLKLWTLKLFGDCGILSGEGPTITGRTPLTTIWHLAGSLHDCAVPTCCETATASTPDGGIAARRLGGIRARITELESSVTFAGERSDPFTYTMLVERKFVPVM